MIREMFSDAKPSLPPCQLQHAMPQQQGHAHTLRMLSRAASPPRGMLQLPPLARRIMCLSWSVVGSRTNCWQ